MWGTKRDFKGRGFPELGKKKEAFFGGGGGEEVKAWDRWVCELPVANLRARLESCPWTMRGESNECVGQKESFEPALQG